MRWCDICQQPWSFAYCGHHRTQRQAPPTPPASARVSCAVPATLDHVYRELLAALPLTPTHRQALRQRGLADSEICRRQYGTLPRKGRAALAKRMVAWWDADTCAQVPGFYGAGRDGRRWWSFAGAAGLLIPVRNRDGHIVALKVRADDPGNGPKYTMISSAKYSKMTPPEPKARHEATLRTFGSRVFTLCSTWVVMRRKRNAGCSWAMLHEVPGSISSWQARISSKEARTAMPKAFSLRLSSRLPWCAPSPRSVVSALLIGSPGHLR
jgi:hypothetical protein